MIFKLKELKVDDLIYLETYQAPFVPWMKHKPARGRVMCVARIAGDHVSQICVNVDVQMPYKQRQFTAVGSEFAGFISRRVYR